MSATLQLTHKAIGAEVRRGTYDVVLDGERVGSVGMNATFETSSNPDVTPCKSATAENRAEPRPSTPPTAKPSRSAAPEKASCRSSSCHSWFTAGHSRSSARPRIEASSPSHTRQA